MTATVIIITLLCLHAPTIMSANNSGTSPPRDLNTERSYEKIPPQERITRGYDCRIDDHPYFVALYDAHIEFCGGSIYNMTHIITAAHCCVPEAQITVRAGKQSLNSMNDEIRGTNRKMIHPDYNKNTLEFDVCLLELDEPLPEGDRIKPVRLGTMDTVSRIQRNGYTNAMVMGFGYDTEFINHKGEMVVSNAKQSLQCGRVDVLPVEQCRKEVGDFFFPMSMMCIMSPQGGNICFGDSGGPLMADGVQIGVASFIPTFACDVPFAIFARIDYRSSHFLTGLKSYFWHITDFHYDPHFVQHGDVRKGCWKPNGSREPHGRNVGKYGDYSCDAPWDLIESATKAMVSRQGDNVEFVLWTGDNLSLRRQVPESKQLDLLQRLTDLLLKTFNSQFVFPALGHDDPTSRLDLGKMWSRWLPPDTIETLETGGYYMIEKTDFKRHIIVLNTNLMTKQEDDDESRRQWDWLTQMLDKVYQRKETVYIVGHIPPGLDERQRGTSHREHLMYTDHNNRKYLRLVRKYASIIQGQFFGHLHSDSFRIIYSERGSPASWIMLSPALTPRRTADGANNPGLRLYKFKKDTGQILDYTQYYLDLSLANSNPKVEPEWIIEYNFSSYYGISNITPLSLHTLAERLSSQAGIHDVAFKNYYRANSVRIHKDHHSCDASCAHIHYCTITRVDYEEHENCLKTAPSALASASGSQQKISTSKLLLTFLVPLVVLV